MTTPANSNAERVARIALALKLEARPHKDGASCKDCVAIEAAANFLVKLAAVAEAARTPDCNFDTERECGWAADRSFYRHHKEWCPRGRLQAALAELDEADGRLEVALADLDAEEDAGVPHVE